MTALCHFRKSTPASARSALAPQADFVSPACQVRKVPTTIIRNRLNSASEVNVDAHCARLSNWGFPKADLKSLVMAKKVKSLAYSHKN